MAPTEYYGPGGLSVDAYDLVEGATRPLEPELAYYRALADGCATPVVELGVGTGRLAWPLAAAGHRVVGVDRSAAMLARAEAKRAGQPPETAARLRLVEADMRGFDLGFASDLVIVSYRAFNHLLVPDDQRACLAALYRHLRGSE